MGKTVGGFYTNPKFCFVYCITCLVSDKMYIGISYDPYRRLRQHSKSNFPIGLAIRKYGLRNFVIEIMMVKNDRVKEIERKLIEKLNTQTPNGYNLTAGGDRPTHSTKTILLMRAKRMTYTPSRQTNRKISKSWIIRKCEGLTIKFTREQIVEFKEGFRNRVKESQSAYCRRVGISRAYMLSLMKGQYWPEIP